MARAGRLWLAHIQYEATMLLTRFEYPQSADLSGFMCRSFDTKRGFFVPALDVIESDSAITVKAELPGVESDDVEVSVHNDVLTISGERTQTEPREGERSVRVESSYGRFERRVNLPDGTDANGVEARFNNGILEVTVQRPEKAQPRKIDIES